MPSAQRPRGGWNGGEALLFVSSFTPAAVLKQSGDLEVPAAVPTSNLTVFALFPAQDDCVVVLSPWPSAEPQEEAQQEGRDAKAMRLAGEEEDER